MHRANVDAPSRALGQYSRSMRGKPEPEVRADLVVVAEVLVRRIVVPSSTRKNPPTVSPSTCWSSA